MKKNLIGLTLAIWVLFLGGCGSSNVATQSFVRENANPQLIQKVAVLPFEGGGRAPRIRELTMTQLLATDTFDVIDKGNVDLFLQQEAIAPGSPLDAITIKRMGESLEVDAILLGSVEQLTEARGSASFPVIIITLRLVHCETSQLIWQATGRGSGYSLADRLFGFSPKDAFDVTIELLNKLFNTMRVQES